MRSLSELPRIWFLRHGQTHWNAERRIQGQLESGLTEKGIADAHSQAALLAPILRLKPRCYVSPLKRAVQTAEIALENGPFQIDARLAEAHAGSWQGQLHADIRSGCPELARPEMTDLDLFLAAPGGEGLDAFETRISSFLQDLSAPSVIVAHGLWGQVMRGLVCGLPRTEMGKLSNKQGCVYELDDQAERILR